MKLYLDDTRIPPVGWYLVRTAFIAICFLEKGIVKEISLDHDLGDINETGYDILLWIEERIFKDKTYKPPIIHIHSANVSARKKMELALTKIKELINVS